MVAITEFYDGVERLMPLLLMGDESEEMISRYIKRGRIFTGKQLDEIVAVCVVTEEPDNWIEVKNLAVAPHMRRQGVGRSMLAYAERLYPGRRFRLGTGETPSTLWFYEGCGYHISYRIPDFFTKNYSHPIIEEGVRLKDMLYLVKEPPRRDCGPV